MLEITFARVECELVCSVCSLCVTLLGFRVCHRDSGGSSCVRQSGVSCVSFSWSFLATGHALGSCTGQSARDTTRKLMPSKMIRSRGGTSPEDPGIASGYGTSQRVSDILIAPFGNPPGAACRSMAPCGKHAWSLHTSLVAGQPPVDESFQRTAAKWRVSTGLLPVESGVEFVRTLEN